jgi:hypothetical protein
MRALHFHHIEPSLKLYSLSNSGHTIGLSRLREEAKKCILLCSNCHSEYEDGLWELDELAGGRLAM